MIEDSRMRILIILNKNIPIVNNNHIGNIDMIRLNNNMHTLILYIYIHHKLYMYKSCQILLHIIIIHIETRVAFFIISYTEQLSFHTPTKLHCSTFICTMIIIMIIILRSSYNIFSISHIFHCFVRCVSYRQPPASSSWFMWLLCMCVH